VPAAVSLLAVDHAMFKVWYPIPDGVDPENEVGEQHTGVVIHRVHEREASAAPKHTQMMIRTMKSVPVRWRGLEGGIVGIYFLQRAQPAAAQEGHAVVAHFDGVALVATEDGDVGAVVGDEEADVAAPLASVEDGHVAQFHVFALDLLTHLQPATREAWVLQVGGILVAHVNCHGVHEAATPRQGGVVFPAGEQVLYHI